MYSEVQFPRGKQQLKQALVFFLAGFELIAHPSPAKQPPDAWPKKNPKPPSWAAPPPGEALRGRSADSAGPGAAGGLESCPCAQEPPGMARWGHSL